MSERTTVRLPKDLLQRAKRKAAAEERTLTSLIEEGLRVVVSGKRQAERHKRILPCVSAADGGLMPGVDLADRTALQDADDFEYVSRMKHFE